MAVENKYVAHNAESTKTVDKGEAVLFSGGSLRVIPFCFEIAAADDNGSIYRIGRVSPRSILKAIWLMGDAITGATSYDIGIYKPLDTDGAVIDKDVFVAARDVNAGLAVLTQVYVPTIDAIGKKIHEIITTPITAYERYGSVDIAFTANTVGSAAGTISGFIEIIDAV